MPIISKNPDALKGVTFTEQMTDDFMTVDVTAEPDSPEESDDWQELKDYEPETELSVGAYLVNSECPNCGASLTFNSEGYDGYEGNCSCGKWDIEISVRLTKK